MFPFVNTTGYHDFGMENEISQETNKRPGGNHHPHVKSKGKDHEIVMLPISPRHSANSGIHLLAKSRLAWLIAILGMIVLILLYQAYFEHLKQLRLISYLERVEELKVSMERLQHSIQAGNDKLQQIEQSYRNATVLTLPSRDI